MNESLCRALIAARLGEEDVAARLGVDPKTVRRWLEGRVPYRRYRWALAALLGADDAVLWPGLRGARQPAEVVAVYPRGEDVSADAWVQVLGAARHEVAVLGRGASFLTGQPAVRPVLLERARKGARVRICLGDPAEPSVDDSDAQLGGDDAGALPFFAPLANCGVQVRLQSGEPYEGMVAADGEMLVLQRVWGVPAAECPVLRLRQGDGSGLFAFYVQSFERVWETARPLA